MRILNIGIFLFSTLFILAIVEFALHFSHFRYLLAPATPQFPPGFFAGDPELGVDHAPDLPPRTLNFRGPAFEVFTNSTGCFARDRELRPGYVLAMGDSGTFSFVAFEHQWTTLLEQRLGVPVMNCGVSGTGPKFQLIKTEKVIEAVGVKPGLIILKYTAPNDLNDDVVFPGYALVDGERVNTMSFLDLSTGKLVRLSDRDLAMRFEIARQVEAIKARHPSRRYITFALAYRARYFLNAGRLSAADRSFGPIMQRWYGRSLLTQSPAEYPWLEEAFGEHLRTLRYFRLLAERNNAELLVVTKDMPDSELAARIENFFREKFDYYLDATEYLEKNAAGRRITHRYDSHANRLGNRLMADAISQYIQDAGIFGRDEP